MKRIFLFAILAIIISGSYFIQQNVYAQQPINEGKQQRILAATVQIKMKAPRIDEAGNPVLTQRDGNWYTVDMMAHGLGTLTQIDNQTFIVTHDHWGDLLATAVTVTFQNAQGQPLAQISGDQFRALIVYQDQGTMVLNAATELAPYFSQAVTAQRQPLSADEQVLLARHQVGVDTVEVVAARVTAVTDRNGVPAYQLQHLDGSPVVEGDSGGGIWLNGQIVGNMWRNVAVETVQLVDGAEVITSQNLSANSIAAAFPNYSGLE